MSQPPIIPRYQPPAYLGSLEPGESAVDDVTGFVAAGQSAAKCQVESVIRVSGSRSPSARLLACPGLVTGRRR